MSVAFRELGGSPVEQYTSDGFTARREFLVAWGDRDAFAREVLGTGVLEDAVPPVIYPGKTSVVAVRLRFEPFDPDGPDQQTLADLTAGPNSYSGSFARAVVDYATELPSSRGDEPEPPDGTFLTYEMRFAGEYQSVPPRGWIWEDAPGIPPPDDLNLAKSIPVTEHHLIWQRVLSPPWDAIRAAQGKVNGAAFLGGAAETILFEGADAEREFLTPAEVDLPTFSWRLHYVFREKAIKHGGQTFGWNHFHRERPPGWARLLFGGQPLYEPADFAPLFQFPAV